MGLLANTILPIGIAVGTNALLFLTGIDFGSEPRVRPDWAPPGAVVGAVWVVLFALMGATRWQAVRADPGRGARAARGVTLLLALCIAFPFYTAGPAGLQIGLAGTLVTAAVALYVHRGVRGVSTAGARLLVPLLLWLAFATFLIVATIRLNVAA